MALRKETLLARSLRREATEAERVLWRAIRQAEFPWKLRRQHPIGCYITDFACPARGLVIELDGGQHADRVAPDEARTAALALHGYRGVRFWNNEVLGNLEGVMDSIRRELDRPSPTSPQPSPPLGAERG